MKHRLMIRYTVPLALWLMAATFQGIAEDQGKNMAVNGDFEKEEEGVPSAWSFQWERGSMSAAAWGESYACEQEGGPVGKRCMLIKPAARLRYMRQTIPTPVLSTNRYRLSAYVKTDHMSGKLILGLIPGKEWSEYWGASVIEKPTQDWTLVKKEFSPAKSDQAPKLVIVTAFEDGQAWIDGVKLELIREGVTAPKPAAQKGAPAKVATDAVESKPFTIDCFYPLGERGLFWEGEPLQFNLSGRNHTGEKREVEMTFVIKDFFGVPAGEKSVLLNVEAGGDFSQTIDLGVMKGRYGFFCVRAFLKEKEVLVDQTATGCCVLRPPDPEKDSFLSANANGGFDSFLVKAMQRIGVTSRGVSFCLSWVPEAQRADLDSYVANDLAHGRNSAFWKSDLRLIGVISEDGERGFQSFAPSWYAAEMKARYRRGEFPDPEAYYREYGDFVEALARQAGGRIKTWAIAQEIDGTLTACPDRRSEGWALERYIRQVKIANERLKKVDPDCTLIALGASCSDLRPPYWSMTREKLLPALKGHFDMAGPDAYCDLWNLSRLNMDSAGCEKENFRDLLLATADLQKSLGSKTKQIAICEKGYGVPYHYEPDDEAVERVNYLMARYLIVAKSVPQVSYVSLFTMSSGAAYHVRTRKKKSDDANPETDFGLWKMAYTPSGEPCFYPRSWAATVATINRLLVNASASMEMNLRKGFYAYAFQKKDRAVAAIWTVEKEPYPIALNLPEALECWDLMGNAKLLPKGRVELTVSECPFFLVGKTSAKKLANLVNQADFPSKPLVKGEVHVSNLSTLTVYLQNTINQPVSARITLDSPSGVKLPSPEKEAVVSAGGKVGVDFEMKGADLGRLNGQTIGGRLVVQGREISFSEKVELTPVPAMKTPVVVNGDLSKYAPFEPILLGGKNLMTTAEYAAIDKQLWKGEDNLSARFYLAWDAGYFYIAARVRDDVHLQRWTGASIWKDDCIQFAFNMQNDAMKPDGAMKESRSDGDYNFGMALTEKGPLGWSWLEAGKETGRLEGARTFPLAIKRVGTETIYETAIPWANLGLLKPETGKVFRFSLVVFDNDNENQPQAKYWLGLTTGVAGGFNPSVFKAFVLAP